MAILSLHLGPGASKRSAPRRRETEQMARNIPRVKTLPPALPSQGRMAQRWKLREKDTLKTLILRLAQWLLSSLIQTCPASVCICVHALAFVYMYVAFSFAIVKEFFFVFVFFFYF